MVRPESRQLSEFMFPCTYLTTAQHSIAAWRRKGVRCVGNRRQAMRTWRHTRTREPTPVADVVVEMVSRVPMQMWQRRRDETACALAAPNTYPVDRQVCLPFRELRDHREHLYAQESAATIRRQLRRRTVHGFIERSIAPLGGAAGRAVYTALAQPQCCKWDGRKWDGRKWDGRKWDGRKWDGRKWERG